MYLKFKKLSLCLSILVICTNIVTLKADCSVLDGFYRIKSTSGDLYLDASSTTLIVLQNYSESASQLWRISCGTVPGMFIFDNNGLKMYLTTGSPYARPSPVILGTEPDLYQWYINDNGRITSGATLYNLDVNYSVFEPGTPVGVYPESGNPNQEWSIVAA